MRTQHFHRYFLRLSGRYRTENRIARHPGNGKVVTADRKRGNSLLQKEKRTARHVAYGNQTGSFNFQMVEAAGVEPDDPPIFFNKNSMIRIGGDTCGIQQKIQ